MWVDLALYLCSQILLMAMKDMNIAKLTSADVPLLNGITQDLFPAVEIPIIDYGKVNQRWTSEPAESLGFVLFASWQCPQKCFYFLSVQQFNYSSLALEVVLTEISQSAPRNINCSIHIYIKCVFLSWNCNA